MNNNTTSRAVKNDGTGVNISGYNPYYRTQATIIAQTVSLGVLGTIIVLGSLASIITFIKTQSLRRRSHYLIICLSVSDLLVGAVVDFMCVYLFWAGPQWHTFVIVLEVMDTLTRIASILTLSNIAIERFYAIFFPFRHRRLRFRAYVALCAFPWITAIYISALYVTHFVYDKSVLVVFLYVCQSFSVTSIALLVILFSYITIGVKLRKSNPSAQNQNRPPKDQKLAITLLIVTLACVLTTWLPLQCFLAILFFCHSCPLPHLNVIFVMKFLHFCNSGINVFIYIVRMPEFRSAFLVLFCGKRKVNVRVPRMNPKNNGIVGNESETGQTCGYRSNVCLKNNSNLSSFSNLQITPGNVQGPHQVNNPTNQKTRNRNSGSENAKESESRNDKKPSVTQKGESSLDKININLKETRDGESRYQGVANYAAETEESGTEDSRL